MDSSLLPPTGEGLEDEKASGSSTDDERSPEATKGEEAGNDGHPLY